HADPHRGRPDRRHRRNPGGRASGPHADHEQPSCRRYREDHLHARTQEDRRDGHSRRSAGACLVTTESVRAYCLSLPHATEDLKPQWGDALLLRIAGKIFVSMSLTQVPLRMNVKCTPERFAELLEVEGVKIADY